MVWRRLSGRADSGPTGQSAGQTSISVRLLSHWLSRASGLARDEWVLFSRWAKLLLWVRGKPIT